MSTTDGENKKVSAVTTPTIDNMFLKSLAATIVKLNGTNYLIWAQSFRLFVGAQKKMKHLTNALSNTQDSECADWLADDYCVIAWLVNSTDVKVSAGVMFLRTAKEIWDTLKEMYVNEKNIFIVFELYK